MAINPYWTEEYKPYTNVDVTYNCSTKSSQTSTQTYDQRLRGKAWALNQRVSNAPAPYKGEWAPYSYDKRRHGGGIYAITRRKTRFCYVYNDWGSWTGKIDMSPYYGGVSYNSTWYTLSHDPGTSKARVEADAIAQAKLLSTLSEARTQWQFAVTLGEARETASHMASTARRLAHGFFAFKKGKIRESYRILAGRYERVPVRHQQNFRALQKRAKSKSWVDDVSNGWMEYSYAWRPLLYDIDSAAKYLAQKHVGQDYTLYRASRAHRARIQSQWLQPVSPGSQPQRRFIRNDAAHVRYTYLLHPDWIRKPSTLNELGFTDPASIVWELLPLSFVVDWFVNVGQVLQSLHEFQQWTVSKGMISYREQIRDEVDRVKNYTGVDSSYKESGGPSFHETIRCRRTPTGVLPTSVPLRIRVDNPFDLNKGQMASAAVLLRYAFR